VVFSGQLMPQWLWHHLKMVSPLAPFTVTLPRHVNNFEPMVDILPD